MRLARRRCWRGRHNLELHARSGFDSARAPSRAELNFEKLVEILSTRGYITDVEHEHGLSFVRASVNQTRARDFDALFALLMPGRLNDIRLMTTASSEGTNPGTPTYAVFNTNVIGYQEMRDVLATMNRAGVQD